MKKLNYSSLIASIALSIIALPVLLLVAVSHNIYSSGHDQTENTNEASSTYFNESRLDVESNTAAAAAVVRADDEATAVASADTAVSRAAEKISPGSKVTVSGNHISVSAPVATPPVSAPPASAPPLTPQEYDARIGPVAIYTDLYSLIAFLSALPINQNVTHQFKSDAEIAPICKNEAAAACIDLFSAVVYLKSSAMSAAPIDTSGMSVSEAAVVRVLQQFYTVRYDHAIKHEYCHAMLYKLGGFGAALNENAAESCAVIVLGAADYGTLYFTDTITGRRLQVEFLSAPGYGRTAASDALVRELFSAAGLI